MFLITNSNKLRYNVTQKANKCRQLLIQHLGPVQQTQLSCSTHSVMLSTFGRTKNIGCQFWYIHIGF